MWNASKRVRASTETWRAPEHSMLLDDDYYAEIELAVDPGDDYYLIYELLTVDALDLDPVEERFFLDGEELGAQHDHEHDLVDKKLHRAGQ